MSFVPEGCLSLTDTIELFRRWFEEELESHANGDGPWPISFTAKSLRRASGAESDDDSARELLAKPLRDFALASDDRKRAELQNQFRQALYAEDLIAYTRPGSRQGKIDNEHWLDDASFEYALGGGQVDDPEDGSPRTPFILFNDVTQLLFGRWERFNPQSPFGLHYFGRTLPYKMLPTPEEAAVNAPQSNSRAEKLALAECRELLKQDSDQTLSAGALGQQSAMKTLPERGRKRVLSILRKDYPYISNPGRKKSVHPCTD